MKLVYLCGPITGLSYNVARHGWREQLGKLLVDGSNGQIHPISPMRAKDFLANQRELRGDPEMYENPLATAHGIITRDRWDVQRCDLMVANLLGAERVSIGSMVEFGWADAYRKPVVTIIEPNEELYSVEPPFPPVKMAHPNPHWHAFVTGLSGYIVPSVEDAADIILHLLTPGC